MWTPRQAGGHRVERPRAPQIAEAGGGCHVLNRRVMRPAVFEQNPDPAAFERVLAAAPKLLAYRRMSNHWHLVEQAGQRTLLST